MRERVLSLVKQCFFNFFKNKEIGQRHKKINPIFIAMLIGFSSSAMAVEDWGDAPAPYPTLNADNGPNHTYTAALYMGSCIN